MATPQEISIQAAQVGDMVTEASLPAEIVNAGGGWVAGKYVCHGAHMVAGECVMGWLCKQIGRPSWL